MYRKFKADYIFDGYQLWNSHKVLITDQQGIVQEIVDEPLAGENIEVFKGMLTPGFVNCHCHLELSHLKGFIEEKTGLVNFVQQVMVKRTASQEQKLLAMQAAEQEMYNSGTVAVGDICNTTDSLSVKKQSKIRWHNFIEVSGFVDATAEKRMAEALNIQGQFLSTINYSRRRRNRHLSTISPHAPYSVSKKLFQLINNATTNQLITIHNQECAAEDELYKNKSGDFLQLYKNLGIDVGSFEPTGKTSLESWLPYFTINQSIISVHNTFLNQNLSSINYPLSSLFFCLCVNANRYIENTIPPIQLLAHQGAGIVIGTDSYASNWQLNMLEEIKVILQQNIPLVDVLHWATQSGAEALRMDEQLGSFEKGKQPGIVLIDNIDNGNISATSSARRIL